MMDRTLVLLVMLLSSLPVYVFSCKTNAEFEKECKVPYENYFNSSTFWSSICSVSGRTILTCIKTQIDECSSEQFAEQESFFDEFNTLFGAFQMSFDFACEYNTREICQTVRSCYPDSLFDFVGTTVYSFYEYFCGTEKQYLQHMISCVAGLASANCTITLERYSGVYQPQTPGGQFDVTAHAAKITTECSKLSVSDAQCIQNRATELEECIQSDINIPDASITCAYNDQSKACVSDKCEDTVATFYDEIFRSIKCARNVDGRWSEWTDWSTCTKSCEAGTHLRTRACNNPEPVGEGRACEGDDIEVDQCNAQGCPVDGKFGFWGFWSECSLNCGGGTRTRTRFCNNPPASNGGNECVGDSSQSEACNEQECSGVYTEWTPWDQCSGSCGAATQTRSRICEGGGICGGPSTEERDCGLPECPVDGGFTDWGLWSECTKSCGVGSYTRTRSCTNPEPAFGGNDCDGDVSQTDLCNEHSCLATLCPEEINSYGTWPTTVATLTVVLQCQKTEEIGSYSRRCGQDGMWGNVTGNCEINPEVLTELEQELQRLLTSDDVVSGDVGNIIKNLTDLTEDVDSTTSGDILERVVQTAETFVDVIEKTKVVTEEGNKNFFKLIDNIANPTTEDVWNGAETDVDGSDVLSLVDRYTAVAAEFTCERVNAGTIKDYDNTYIYSEIGKTQGGVRFPRQKQTDSYIDIPAAALAMKGVSTVCFGGSTYKAIGNIIKSGSSGGSITDSSVSKQTVNSDVVSVQLTSSPGVTYIDITPPIRVILKPTNENLTKPVCVFWDYNITTNGRNGDWSPEGCSVAEATRVKVVCECSHLTNFAVLMSPSETDIMHSQILSIISAVGCAISMVCLILTIAAHVLVWRLVRSDRAIILMNLCVALLIALGVFLAGVNRTESSIACTVIAAIIQYLFLAVFFFMLLSGIEILICVVHVFVTKFRIKIFLPVAWLAPAVIVGVSLGVTKTEGYGNGRFCWLDIDSGLIWSFIGPAALVILINLIVIVIVFKKMASSNALKTKTSAVKIKTGLRSLCVLLPLMGLTWVFGILSVNNSMVFLQYLFCIFNTLQGLFIFLFHCVFNRQIRDAIKRRQERKRSLQTFSSDMRKQSRSHSKEARKLSREGNSSEAKNGVDNKAFVGRDRRKKSEDYDAEDWDKLERRRHHKNIRRGDKVFS